MKWIARIVVCCLIALTLVPAGATIKAQNGRVCDDLVSAVTAIESRIDRIQERLQGVSPSMKPELLRQIRNLQSQLEEKRNELRCCRQRNGIRTEPPLPPSERLASDLNIKLDWVTGSEDLRLRKVERLLRAFNNRLYDTTDGQWRVGRFLIHDHNNALAEEDAGVGHIAERSADGSPNHGHAQGRPNRPEHFHFTMSNLDNTDESANTFAGTFLMEFLHSWTGLKDEYETTAGGRRTSCPLRESDQFPNSCVMYRTRDPNINELCRPENHNPNTEQGNTRGMDCYSWLVKVMKESGHRGFMVPCSYVAGPRSAPTLRFVYVTIQRVRQLESPVGDDLGDFYARVSIDGARFSRSSYRSNDGDVRPGWCFGLAYSSNRSRSIPITIEIFDVVSNAADKQCDVNPNRNKRTLNLTYDPRTGEIGGDVDGLHDRRITVSGEGASSRVAIDFTITSR
jgi:hypothetical protein